MMLHYLMPTIYNEISQNKKYHSSLNELLQEVIPSMTTTWTNKSQSILTHISLFFNVLLQIQQLNEISHVL